MSNQTLIREFYQAFAERDGATMAKAYAADATFSDPVFPHLVGPAIGDMWSMLCEAGKDLRVEASDIVVNGDQGSAHWEAWYSFSATGRKVHNKIDASFRFRDGKIVAHRDVFPLYAWTKMALGPAGWALGWTPILRGALRKKAAAGLAAYQRGRS